MAFSPRAHWHGYLMVFVHGSILHHRKDSFGNSQQSDLAVSMLEKTEMIFWCPDGGVPSTFEHLSQAPLSIFPGPSAPSAICSINGSRTLLSE